MLNLGKKVITDKSNMTFEHLATKADQPFNFYQNGSQPTSNKDQQKFSVINFNNPTINIIQVICEPSEICEQVPETVLSVKHLEINFS